MQIVDFLDTICYDMPERGDFMPTNIGTRIMERRQQLGWTQADLAFKMGYKTKSAINKIELGINDVSQSKVVKFAEVLHTSIGYLMGWEGDIEKDPVGMVERHFEILMDEDISDIFDEFKTLDPTQKKLVKDLVHSLAEAKKAEA
jgi:transcriptional regulator with XRE-family HTH domain